MAASGWSSISAHTILHTIKITAGLPPDACAAVATEPRETESDSFTTSRHAMHRTCRRDLDPTSLGR